jgi:Fe-S oxidoreductase/nitrate reductase gamma subunit
MPGTEITRELYWNVVGTGFPVARVLSYVLAFVAIVLFIRGLFRKGGLIEHIKMMKLATGPDVPRTDNTGKRLKFALAEVFTHRKILREPYQGIAHLFIFWGFIALFFGTFMDFFQGDIIEPLFHTNILQGGFYLFFSLITDLGGIFVLIGVIMFLIRRYTTKPKWLDDKPEDKIILWLILAIVVTGFLIEALRMQATELQPGNPMYPYAWYSFGGHLFTLLLSGLSINAAKTVHGFVWWVHLFIVLGFVIYVAYSKLLHIFTLPANIFMHNATKNPAPLKEMPPEMFETAETFGIHTLEEYSWKDLFDAETCIRCGRCVAVCPAFMTDKPLLPRDVIQSLRDHLDEKAKLSVDANGRISLIPEEDYKGPALIGNVVDKDTVWACTTCMACIEACPAYISQFPKLIDLRRYLSMMESDFPAEVQDVFKGMENNANPWNIGSHTRADWAKDLDVPLLSKKGEAEYLFYVGCAGALDDLNKKVAVALAKIFNAAGIDYAILGTEEGCCGDSARKIGNEYLYQMLATTNIEVFNGYKVKKIITMCPHGYNTLKYDYKELGGDYEVYHYTEILEDLIKNGKLSLKNPVEGLGTMAYHDSCYLGRYNKIYDQPRNILKAMNSGTLVEMANHHEKSLCCGAGGGRMWMEETLGTRINQKRTEEAIDAGIKTVCTACPFCYTMLADGIKELGKTGEMQAFDIAQLVVKAAGLD